MKLRNGLAWLAGAYVGAATAQAPVPDAAAAPPLPPQYEVEIIVFANREFDPTEERFEPTLHGLPAEPLVPLAPLGEVPVFDETTLPRAAPPEPTAPPEIAGEPQADPLADARAAAEEALRIRPLPASELKLVNEYRRLQSLSAYEPLLHTAWVQPGLPESEAKPFDLGTLGVLNPSGTVRVHLSRFLHITLDLTYQGGSAAAVQATDELAELSFAPRYRLAATRSSRSGELHYFDHPAFGVLVRITPLPAPGASTDAGRRPAA
jgi:hypothetical protein